MTELVKQPYDPFWDAPSKITRRELQQLFNKLAFNDSELMGMADTAALVINYILEVHLKVKREDLDVYVEAKKLQLSELREKMATEAGAAAQIAGQVSVKEAQVEVAKLVTLG
jgi:hypothetical protein